MQKILNYVNGELVEPTSKNYFDNINPATGNVYSQIPDSDEHDIEIAVAAATTAFAGWSNMPVANRSNIRLKDYQLLK